VNPAPPLRIIADIQNRLEAHVNPHALLSHVEGRGSAMAGSMKPMSKASDVSSNSRPML